jgi:hypothetical protein
VRRPGRRFNGAVLSLSLSFGYMTVGAFLTQMYYDRRLFFFFFFYLLVWARVRPHVSRWLDFFW